MCIGFLIRLLHIHSYDGLNGMHQHISYNNNDNNNNNNNNNKLYDINNNGGVIL